MFLCIAVWKLVRNQILKSKVVFIVLKIRRWILYICFKVIVLSSRVLFCPRKRNFAPLLALHWSLLNFNILSQIRIKAFFVGGGAKLKSLRSNIVSSSYSEINMFNYIDYWLYLRVWIKKDNCNWVVWLFVRDLAWPKGRFLGDKNFKN